MEMDKVGRDFQAELEPLNSAFSPLVTSPRAQESDGHLWEIWGYEPITLNIFLLELYF